VWWDDIQGDLVPDAVYVAINGSKAIEPGLRKAIQYSLSPELRVRELVEVERKYHHDKKITSGPGYRALETVASDKTEAN
jgi:adenosylmethionine-8-amino-7-oxononanoate aminotransferase